MNLTDPQERAVICGQYVIGLLEQAEAQEFERLMQQDPTIGAEVARWQDHLLGLTARVGPLEPSADLWTRIERSLPAPAPQVVPSAPRAAPARRDSWWDSLLLWRSVSALGLALSLVLAMTIALQEPQAKVYVAVLRSPAQQSGGWMVQASSRGTIQLTPLQPATDIPSGKSLQFWTKLPGAEKPVSLGLVQPGDTVEIPWQRLPGLADNQLFEITLEPEAGSPTGLPTGPILFVGNANQI